MAKFIIQPHGRLNDWVAEEKGYFTAEGLDYELNVEGSRKNTPRLATVDSPIPLEDNRFGAFERYAEGHGRKGEGAGDVSCACHWTVNQAAKIEEGVMWGKAYSVCEAAIMVPGDCRVSEPGDLARTDIAVGYHSGSHYSALQALEVFLAPEDIALKFVGSSWSRVDCRIGAKNTRGERVGTPIISVGAARLSENCLHHFYDGLYVSPGRRFNKRRTLYACADQGASRHRR